MNNLKQYIEQTAKRGAFNTYYSFPLAIPILGLIKVDIRYTEEQNLMRENYEGNKLPYINVSENVLNAVNTLSNFNLSVYKKISNMFFGNFELEVFEETSYSFPGDNECKLALSNLGIKTIEEFFKNDKINIKLELRNDIAGEPLFRFVLENDLFETQFQAIDIFEYLTLKGEIITIDG